MDFYFRWTAFLSALAPYDGSYWAGVTADDDEPPAAESLTREETTAARKMIPGVPRPRGTANTPAGERQPSRKLGTSKKKHAKTSSSAQTGLGAVPAPVASGKEDKAPMPAQIKAPVIIAPASEPKPPEAPPRRCRVHQRRANPPPLRACLLCRLAAAKA